MPTTIYFDYLASPLGELLVAGDGECITRLYLPNHKGAPRANSNWRRSSEPFHQVRDELSAYFRGERKIFDVQLRPEGTEFQQRVWEELVSIPFGNTITYAELARRIGRPTASRAVGHANGRNPISIIIPCHRVIGVDGRLTGYAGGLDNKRWLLDFERGERTLAFTPPSAAATS